MSNACLICLDNLNLSVASFFTPYNFNLSLAHQDRMSAFDSGANFNICQREITTFLRLFFGRVCNSSKNLIRFILEID